MELHVVSLFSQVHVSVHKKLQKKTKGENKHHGAKRRLKPHFKYISLFISGITLQDLRNLGQLLLLLTS